MKLIILSGKAKSGKTTLATNLYNSLIVDNKDVEIIKIADPLYNIMKLTQEILHQNVIKDREFLINTGDLLKAHYGDNIFINTFMTSVSKSGAEYIICDDMRFKNEFKSIKNTFKDLALTIRLECSQKERNKRNGVFSSGEHISETNLDDEINKFDMVFDSGALSSSQITNAVLEVINER